MTEQQHSITPPDSLVWEWMGSIDTALTPTHVAQALAAKVAQWSADQQLEACCDYLRQLRPQGNVLAERLLAVCRPKPPNKKQRGLTALEATNLKKDDPLLYQEILNAIEALPND